MMEVSYLCDDEERQEQVSAHPTLNGIDYLEVLDQEAPTGSPRQQTLLVYCLKRIDPTLDGNHVQIERSAEAAVVNVEWAVRADDAGSLPATDISPAEVALFTGLVDADHVLVVRTDAPGDFSTYTLRLVTSLTDAAPPDPFDLRLATIDFSFKVECPSDFDCKVEPVCPPEPLTEPEIDYLAKDYASFRRLMLDRLSILMPGWTDRNAADVQVALVELLAYVGDHLSYYQDAVATEAYLGTARRRVSMRRHARLLDYFMHDGCNARAWVHLTVTEGGGADNSTLPAGTPLRSRGDDYLVFETMHDVDLRSAHNDIGFYTWSDVECCLPRGSTRATLRAKTAAPLDLHAGDVLLFEEVRSPTTGLPADADPAHRHAVRLTEATPTTDPLDGTAVVDVAWHEDDALPFALCLTALISAADGAPGVAEISVVRGNVALADQGRTIVDEDLTPAAVPDEGRYRPRLKEEDVTFAAPYAHAAARQQSAAATIAQDPRAALPEVTLRDEDETWRPQRDLLASDRFAAEFVVEVERDGRAYLRFGDDLLGKAPSAGTAFLVTYRVGNGPDGNVGAGAISEVVGVSGIEAVRNLLPAVGGTTPESMKEVRQYAPQAFRTQQRAVTEADYAEVAERHPGVQKAAATFRWTGSWYTVFVTIDRKGGLTVSGDDRFRRELLDYLNRFRMAGYDLKVNDPVFVSLDLLLSVCVKPGYFRGNVQQTLLQAFSRHDLPDGRRGFFHPDNFTFGQPVYLSQIYQTAMNVAGVASVEVKRFRRWGKRPNKELENGLLKPASLEVIRLDNDPSEPENGKIELEMLGGL